MQTSCGVFGWRGCTQNLMGSALQGSELLSSGEQPHSSLLGSVTWGRNLWKCPSRTPWLCCHGHHLTRLCAGTERTLRHQCTSSLFHREFHCRKHEVWLGRCAGNREMRLSVPHAPVPHCCGRTALLALCRNISVPVPSSLC